jgi:hypothetical protein
MSLQKMMIIPLLMSTIIPSVFSNNTPIRARLSMMSLQKMILIPLLLMSTIMPSVFSDNTPIRARLSLNAFPNSIIVTWTTMQKPVAPIVRFGAVTTTKTKWNVQMTSRVEKESTCIPSKAPSTYEYPLRSYTSAFIGSCTLNNLIPGVTYSYTVESSPNERTKPFRFTLPKIGDSMRVAFIGDLGQTANSTHTRDHILAAQPFNYNHIVIVGDMSYADSQHSGSSCQHATGCTPKRWDTWEDFYTPLGAIMPTMVLPGNHEVEVPHAPLNQLKTDVPFLNYHHRFPMPHINDSQYYFSYEAGDLSGRSGTGKF